MILKKDEVFIHRSIKTRIETENRKNRPRVNSGFLYIDPLKQGLKLCARYRQRRSRFGFYT